MGFVVVGLIGAVVMAGLVIWGALVWEKDTGGLDADTQARVEAAQQRWVSRARTVWQRLTGMMHSVVRALRPRRKATTG